MGAKRKKVDMLAVLKSVEDNELDYRCSPKWILEKLIGLIEICADPSDPKAYNPSAAIKGLELLGKRVNVFEPPKDEGVQAYIPFVEVNINNIPARASSEDEVEE